MAEILFSRDALCDHGVMMAWPLASHFQTILQNPRVAFRDPELRSCYIERDSLGQPRARSGAFACVYKGIDAAGNPRAIRVFSTESPQRRERYDLIAECLKTRRLHCLVDFEYRPEEIRLFGDGKRYPVVLMDWVEGQTLFHWVRCQCHAGRKSALEEAARQWLVLIKELSEAQIAHGDLQHANVMVTPGGQLKLVDYDGMCVPALVGRRNFEVGTPPYQHPQRSAETLLSLRLDDFSAILIYLALRALAAEPQLWSKYIEQPGYDRLLFREDDLRDPVRSALRQDLQRSPDRQARKLTECLFTSAAGDIRKVPQLSELVTNQQHSVVVPLPWSGRVPRGSKSLISDRVGYGGLTEANRVDERRGATPQVRTLGPKIAGYEIGSRLGNGCLGTVYRAVPQSGGHAFAIKIVHAGNAVNEYHRRRFQFEMDRAKQLRHPNIVALSECGTTDRDFYFVMEYCDEDNLAQWLTRQGDLPLAHLRTLMSQCLDALQHAHLHNVIHGNLKPQNIFWDTSSESPVAKIAEFALARALETVSCAGVAATGGHRFDERFMPRERFTSDRDYRPVSDLWSLAAVCYHSLTGLYPYDFGNKDPVEVIMSEEPVPLRQRDDSIPVAVANVLDRALRTSTTQRYPSASEMKAALEQAFSTRTRPPRAI